MHLNHFLEYALDTGCYHNPLNTKHLLPLNNDHHKQLADISNPADEKQPVEDEATRMERIQAKMQHFLQGIQLPILSHPSFNSNYSVGKLDHMADLPGADDLATPQEHYLHLYRQPLTQEQKQQWDNYQITISKVSSPRLSSPSSLSLQPSPNLSKRQLSEQVRERLDRAKDLEMRKMKYEVRMMERSNSVGSVRSVRSDTCNYNTDCKEPNVTATLAAIDIPPEYFDEQWRSLHVRTPLFSFEREFLQSQFNALLVQQQLEAANPAEILQNDWNLIGDVELLPFHLEGDTCFYRNQPLLARAKLRNDPRLVRCMELFWQLFQRKDSHFGLIKAEYCAVHLRMQKAVYRFNQAKANVNFLGQSLEFDEEAAQKIASADWHRDLNRTAGSRFGLKQQAFYDSLFELVDLWTQSTDIDEYMEFLTVLYHRITKQSQEQGENESFFEWKTLEEIKFESPQDFLAHCQQLSLQRGPATELRSPRLAPAPVLAPEAPEFSEESMEEDDGESIPSETASSDGETSPESSGEEELAADLSFTAVENERGAMGNHSSVVATRKGSVAVAGGPEEQRRVIWDQQEIDRMAQKIEVMKSSQTHTNLPVVQSQEQLRQEEASRERTKTKTKKKLKKSKSFKTVITATKEPIPSEILSKPVSKAPARRGSVQFTGHTRHQTMPQLEIPLDDCAAELPAAFPTRLIELSQLSPKPLVTPEENSFSPFSQQFLWAHLSREMAMKAFAEGEIGFAKNEPADSVGLKVEPLGARVAGLLEPLEKQQIDEFEAIMARVRALTRHRLADLDEQYQAEFLADERKLEEEKEKASKAKLQPEEKQAKQEAPANKRKEVVDHSKLLAAEILAAVDKDLYFQSLHSRADSASSRPNLQGISVSYAGSSQLSEKEKLSSPRSQGGSHGHNPSENLSEFSNATDSPSCLRPVDGLLQQDVQRISSEREAQSEEEGAQEAATGGNKGPTVPALARAATSRRQAIRAMVLTLSSAEVQTITQQLSLIVDINSFDEPQAVQRGTVQEVPQIAAMIFESSDELSGSVLVETAPYISNESVHSSAFPDDSTRGGAAAISATFSKVDSFEVLEETLEESEGAAAQLNSEQFILANLLEKAEIYFHAQRSKLGGHNPQTEPNLPSNAPIKPPKLHKSRRALVEKKGKSSPPHMVQSSTFVTQPPFLEDEPLQAVFIDAPTESSSFQHYFDDPLLAEAMKAEFEALQTQLIAGKLKKESHSVAWRGALLQAQPSKALPNKWDNYPGLMVRGNAAAVTFTKISRTIFTAESKFASGNNTNHARWSTKLASKGSTALRPAVLTASNSLFYNSGRAAALQALHSPEISASEGLPTRSTLSWRRDSFPAPFWSPKLIGRSEIARIFQDFLQEKGLLVVTQLEAAKLAREKSENEPLCAPEISETQTFREKLASSAKLTHYSSPSLNARLNPQPPRYSRPNSGPRPGFSGHNSSSFTEFGASGPPFQHFYKPQNLVILGNCSASQRALLSTTGISFSCFEAASIDPSAVPISPQKSAEKRSKSSPRLLSLGLALARADLATKLAARRRGLLVSCAQIAHFHREIRGKPKCAEECRNWLQQYCAQPLHLTSTVLVTDLASHRQFHRSVTARQQLSMPIPTAIVEKLIEQGDIMNSLGGFLIDSPLIQPFLGERDGAIDEIMGLPLKITASLLRKADKWAIQQAHSEKRRRREYFKKSKEDLSALEPSRSFRELQESLSQVMEGRNAEDKQENNNSGVKILPRLVLPCINEGSAISPRPPGTVNKAPTNEMILDVTRMSTNRSNEREEEQRPVARAPFRSFGCRSDHQVQGSQTDRTHIKSVKLPQLQLYINSLSNNDPQRSNNRVRQPAQLSGAQTARVSAGSMRAAITQQFRALAAPPIQSTPPPAPAIQLKHHRAKLNAQYSHFKRFARLAAFKNSKFVTDK
jgi:predicted house-cleaning NTP pyrophosphatase (Maf/HAM1 superfamily)